MAALIKCISAKPSKPGETRYNYCVEVKMNHNYRWLAELGHFNESNKTKNNTNRFKSGNNKQYQ